VSGGFQYDEPSSVASCKRLSFQTDAMTDERTPMLLAIFVIVLIYSNFQKCYSVSRFVLDDT
jgi:hypothetical protein